MLMSQAKVERHHLYLYDRPWNPDQLELLPVGPPSPAKTVTFHIYTGTGNKHPTTGKSVRDWDEAEITWTGDDGLPVEDLQEADGCIGDRDSLRDVWTQLLSLGYTSTPLRHLHIPLSSF